MHVRKYILYYQLLPPLSLSLRYVALDQEMEEISRVWRLAKEHLTHSLHQVGPLWGQRSSLTPSLQRESQRQCEIKADGNEFLKMKNSTETSKNKLVID